MKQYLIAGAVVAYTLYQVFFADDRDERPPNRPQSYDFSQPSVRRHDERQHRQSVDPLPKDYTPVESYVSLGNGTRQEGELKAQCSRQGQEAYEDHNCAHSKALPDKGKHRAIEEKNLNTEASVTTLEENRQDKARGTIDLHGFRVKEAIAYSEEAVAEARQRGDSKIRLIVGKGIHSEDGIPRLKRAVQTHMRKHGVPTEVDPRNPGVLVVQLSGR